MQNVSKMQVKLETKHPLLMKIKIDAGILSLYSRNTATWQFPLKTMIEGELNDKQFSGHAFYDLHH
jgi:hypothetical protein